MTKDAQENENLAALLKAFPPNSDTKSDNPAIRIYGKRFYKDQTPIEYLAEFLLVFASPKRKNGEGRFQFSLCCDANETPRYWPENRVALKLFSFFPSSKLETRHTVHREAYLDAIEAIKDRICGNNEDKEEAVRLIQSLFSGFVGVAKNRTWVTYTFLPASTNLLGRELVWSHSKAKNDIDLKWKDSKKYLDNDRHIFMARGGELLYLQLVNLFNQNETLEFGKLINNKDYLHLQHHNISDLRTQLEGCLQEMLSSLSGQIDYLVRWIENSLENYKLNINPKHANLGWVPSSSSAEAFLFATEFHNICNAKLGTLDKLDLMQLLCCIHVLRSLCFQARRIDVSEKTTERFIGNYVWIVTDPDAKPGAPIRQMAQNSFERVESLLYRVLKSINKNGTGSSVEADKHGFQIFRKISKEIGLVIPQKGSGQRFTLDQQLIRFLIAALVRPGERIRLNHFYQRVFAHYGIALGGEQLAVALRWCGNEVDVETYSITADTAWVEEALQQGGFLVELSDAVSMVKNPG
ncbi:MAG: hypothetical protein KJ725_06725 [Gammaproteobacteria bacterium]|nr:hypothetical protein [Gammaproteobacteria bacterium]